MTIKKGIGIILILTPIVSGVYIMSSLSSEATLFSLIATTLVVLCFWGGIYLIAPSKSLRQESQGQSIDGSES